MPQGSTTCARTMADNVDYQQRGGLRLDDAMAIHAALHTPSVHEVRISTGDLLPIESNEQGVRRCIIGRESARPKGRAKLMAQNPHKQSMAAAKAREGHNITHILPMDRYGHHTLAESAGDWGCIGWNSTTGAPGYPRLEPNILSKNCAAVLNQADVERHKAAHGKAYTPPSAPSPTGAAAAATSAAGSAASQLSPPPGSLDRTYLNVPFAEKDQAKQLGARWEPQPTCKWYVPPGLALARFARWLPLGPSSPQPQPPQPSPQPQPPKLTVLQQLAEKEIACELRDVAGSGNADAIGGAAIGGVAIGGTAAVGPSWQPPTTRDEEEECATFTGERTREERDAEGRKNAVSLDEDEEHVSSAEAASVKVKAETVAAEAPAAAAEAPGAAEAPEARETKRARTDAPSTSSAALSWALSTAGAKAETLAAKVGRIREALGLSGSMPVATVLLEAYKELGLPPPEAVLLPAQAAELLQVLGI